MSGFISLCSMKNTPLHVMYDDVVMVKKPHIGPTRNMSLLRMRLKTPDSSIITSTNLKCMEEQEECHLQEEGIYHYDSLHPSCNREKRLNARMVARGISRDLIPIAYGRYQPYYSCSHETKSRC